MGSENKKKKSYRLGTREAAEYLRWLADAVEREAVELTGSEEGLSGLIRIKESVKTKTDKSAHKIQIKFSVPRPEQDLRIGLEPEAELVIGGGPDSSGPPLPTAPSLTAEPSGPSYKKLKKAMAKEFAAIRKRLKEGLPPDPVLIKPFYDQCLMMIGYPGKGDPHYPRFRVAAEAMLKAAEAGDRTGLETALEDLAGLKKECHKEFK